ncbi:MAG: cellulose synthase catalytic subunit, partial [Bacteroidota bacterium]
MSNKNSISIFRRKKPKLDPGIQFIKAPAFWDKWIMRVLISLGIASLIYFLQWFGTPDHIGYLPLYLLLAIAIGFKLLKVIHEWYHYFGLASPVRPVQKQDYTVDMLTTFCAGEPYEMIVDTLKAMVAVRYPHTTYLCDEANDPYLKQVCEELGVIHVYRGKDKTHAKAGNINYALRTRATGEITVILDPDHRPSPDFLDRVLPYFNESKVGYVQCVQAYKNRNESFIAKGAAQQTYHFYGPMMMSMHTYGTVQAIGANCTFRRAALDEIGGHSAGLSEDMHTSMQLHAKGWRSVYVPEALTRGLVPATLSGYYKQQLKWSRGTFELLFRVFPKLAFNFTFRQFLHYLTLPLYFLAGLITFIDLIVPIAALLMAQAPWRVDINELIQHTLPLLTTITLIRQYAQKWLLEEHERGFHLLGGALLVGTWWVFLVGLIYTIFRIKVPYIPTPKGDELKNEWRISIPNIVAVLFSLVAIFVGLQLDWSPYSMIMAVYALTNVFMLGFVVLISQQKMLMRMYRALYGGSLNSARRKWYVFRHRGLYPVLRNTYVAFVTVIGIGAISVTSIKPEPKIDLAKWVAPPAQIPGVLLTDYPVQASESNVFWVSRWGQTPGAYKELKLVPAELKFPLDSIPNQHPDVGALRWYEQQGDIPFIQCQLLPDGRNSWRTADLQKLLSGKWDQALATLGEDFSVMPSGGYL